MAAEVGGVHQFGSIYLATAGAAPQGTFKLESSGNGFSWRKQGGGTQIQVGADEVNEIFWSRTGRENILTVKKHDGSQLAFLGFRERDLEEIKARFEGKVHDRELCVNGRNWGDLLIEDSQLSFDVGGTKAFEVTLKDISQASLQGKNEVAIEFQQDDTGTAAKEDALVEMSFYVPPASTQYQSEEDDKSAAKVFLDEVLKKADLVTSSDDIILSMPDIAVVVPRGRYEVQLHMNFLKLVGQSQDFKIRYSSIMRVFVLPKVHQPQTLVVLSLDPPIRKGQTFYPHVLFQFHNDDMEEVHLNLTDEALKKKNEVVGNKLERSFQGPSNDVFAKVVRGLAGVKISRPQKFKNSDGDGHCVRCSYKSDDGYLFPLERAFFYVQKPPILILFDDVESVEFQRQSMSQYASSGKTFDFAVKTKSDVEYLFRSIQKIEYQNLIDFIQERNLKIENLKQVQESMNSRASKAAMDGLDEGGDDDDDSDEDDEDFKESEDDDDDDDDDSDDDSGSGSGSDDDDDDDDASDDDDDDDDDDESDDEDAPKKKKSKK